MKEPKSKILYLYKLLLENTDEQHPLSTTDIIQKLGELGIEVTRKTVASDIALLQEFGVDIIGIRSTRKLYYIASRDFELPEVKLLVDAVESSKLITPKKSKQLVEKLSKLVSREEAKELCRHVFVDKRIKPENERVYYYIDIIHTAIAKSLQIEFQYFDYTPEKKRVYKHNGQIYALSPYALAWNNDHYYALGHCENHGNISQFRVDRMAKVTLMQKTAQPSPNDFNAAEYANRIFDMYDGETKTVELQCDNELMKIIIDRFGEEVHTATRDTQHFMATVDVCISPTFFGWVFQFGERMKILSPLDVQKEYVDMLNRTLHFQT